MTFHQSVQFLIAQAPAAPGGTGGNSLIPLALMVGLVMIYYYLLVVMPRQKMDRERRNMLMTLKKNDHVLTSGGIYGTVVSVDEANERVTVRISDEPAVRVHVNIRSIARLLKEDEKKS